MEAKFPLHKFASNNREILEQIQNNDAATNEPVQFLVDAKTVSVLGLSWHPKHDSFEIKTDIPENLFKKVLTKKMFLSNISRIFDITALLSPVTVNAKLLMQRIWQEKLEWNDPIPNELLSCCLDYFRSLTKLRTLKIPRQYSAVDPDNGLQNSVLMGFADASSKALCACVYLVNNANSCLVCAKTKVAPIKMPNNNITIPKLELEAALLLAKLITRVQCLLTTSKVYCFTDSTIVLAWIKKPPTKLEIFYQNRVQKILSQIAPELWFHVGTKMNPADLSSRGIQPDQLKGNSLWFQGPDFLPKFNPGDAESDVPISVNVLVSVIPKEQSSHENVSVLIEIIAKVSNFNKLINVVVYVNRYLNVKVKKSKFASVTLTVDERKNALNMIIRAEQSTFFESELSALKSNNSLFKNSRLKSLNVFLDHDKIIRAGGRLAHSAYSYDLKYPIIMHCKSKFVCMYIQLVHSKYFHASKEFLMNFKQSKFWIIGGLKSVVKKIIANCVTCVRFKAKLMEQQMGNLPAARTGVSRPFAYVGVDLSGAIDIK